MFGIFMESLVIFKLYTGMKFLIVLFVVALLYLLFTEKNKAIRTMFLYAPLIIFCIFLFPLTRMAWVAFGLDGETYYRILWTIPMGVITAYGFCCMFYKHRRIGLVVTSVLVVLCGSLVYKSPYVTKAENLYHIPEAAVQVCDAMLPLGQERVLTAVFPEDLIHFVRQYNSNIRMPYGRDVIAWGYSNEVYDVYEKPKKIKLKTMLEATRKHYCEYIVFTKGRDMDGKPEDYGLVLIAEIDGYLIYEDPVAVETVKSFGEQQ